MGTRFPTTGRRIAPGGLEGKERASDQNRPPNRVSGLNQAAGRERLSMEDFDGDCGQRLPGTQGFKDD